MYLFNNSELYFSFFSSDKGKITARWCSTRDWAVKLECQAGINLGAYVHINTLIICYTEEGHVVGGSPADIQKGHKVKASVCTGKYCNHTMNAKTNLYTQRHTRQTRPSSLLNNHTYFCQLQLIPSCECRTVLLITSSS